MTESPSYVTTLLFKCADKLNRYLELKWNKINNNSKITQIKFIFVHLLIIFIPFLCVILIGCTCNQ